MNRIFRLAVSLILGALLGATAVAQREQGTQLLELTNAARAEAGAPPLIVDASLSKAAQAHTERMAREGKLSHQFSGETELMRRLAAVTSTPFNAAAENVGVAADLPRAHDAFMHSPPHRKNLLNPAYNVVGFGFVRKGEMLYITEDFAHVTSNKPPEDAARDVAHAVQEMRNQAGYSSLQQRDGSAEKTAACEMAAQDSLNGPPMQTKYTIRYTSFDPTELPKSAQRPIADNAVQSFAVGVCFERTQQYPSGAYWVIISFD